MLTAEQIAILLNRSLTTAETTNFSTYLKISTEKLEELLCMNLCKKTEERTFITRYGYRGVYTDPFRNINSITLDGNAVSEDDYTVMQNDKYNGSWYNLILFDTAQRANKVVVDASWGFNSTPADLQLLLARLFAQNTTDQTTDNQVKSKKIEDFTVTYKDSPTYDEFVLSNSSTIDKYAQCNVSQIRHGAVEQTHYV
jgi:hypothetical protein